MTAKRLAPFVAGLMLAISATTANAVSWDLDGSGTWETGANWSGDAIPGVSPLVGADVLIGNMPSGVPYTVTMNASGYALGTLTIGSGGGGVETLALVGPFSSATGCDATGVSIASDGALHFANRSYQYLYMPSGGTVLNNGTIYGGTSDAPNVYHGIYLRSGGTRYTLVNNGVIDIDGKAGETRPYPYRLVLGGVEFVNNTTVTVPQGTYLSFGASGGAVPLVRGGTFDVSGHLSFAERYGIWGAADDPMHIIIRNGGTFFHGASNNTLGFGTLENHGIVDSFAGSYGATNVVVGATLDNHGTYTIGRLVWNGAIVNRSGGTWNTQGGYDGGIDVRAANSSFVNAGTWNIGNSHSSASGRPRELLGPITNQGTLTFLADVAAIGDYWFGGGSSDANFTNAATGVINKATSLPGHLRGLLTNDGTMNWNGTLWFRSGTSRLVNAGELNLAAGAGLNGNGGIGRVENNAATSRITLAGTNLGDPRNGSHYATIEQTHGDAVIDGTGMLNIDILRDGTGFGRLAGTLKASGGTLALTNWTSGTGSANANTLTITQTGQLIVDNGTVTVDDMTETVLLNGKLGLVNGGHLQVNDVGLTVGSSGYIQNNSGSIEMTTGDLQFESTQNTLFSALGTSLIFSGANQTLGLASQDLGSADSAFFGDNFAFGGLDLAGTGSLDLVAGSGTALYLLGLDFSSGMLLDMNSHNVYVKGAVALPGGHSITAPYGSTLTFTSGDLGGLLLGTGTLSLSYMPEPSAFLLLALAGIAGLGRRPSRRRRGH